MTDFLNLVNPDLLPPQVRTLVRIIGLAETIRLLEARGGIPTYIPLYHDRTVELSGTLAFESLVALAASDLAGKTIELPKCDKIMIQVRNHAIRNARREMSVSRIAREYGLTRRQTINICNAGREDNGMEDLFGTP